MENWIPVVGWEGYYEVSDCGNVRCCPRTVDRYWGSAMWNGRELKPLVHSNGYRNVQLSRGGVSRRYYIHRLVAEAFIENPDNVDYVNHKNGIKSDNCISNLEWVTPSENSIHAFKSGLRHMNLLTVYDSLGSVIHDGVSISDLTSLGFQQPAISRCLSGKLKTHKGCTYKIKE